MPPLCVSLIVPMFETNGSFIFCSLCFSNEGVEKNVGGRYIKFYVWAFCGWCFTWKHKGLATSFLCKPNPNQICTLRALLLCFEVVLGLLVNLSKFEIVHVSLVHNIGDLAQLLGFKVSSLLMTYLGLPLGPLLINPN